MSRPLFSLALVPLFGMAFAASAHAHVCMDAPLSRVGASCNFASPQKNGPCGVNQRSAKPTEFKPGQTITVSLNETIDHPSHYRIAFNPSGDTFEDPTSKDDKSGEHPNILLDGIVDEDAAKQSIQVTLPNVTCDNCTLQLIQVMYDKAGNGFGGKDSAGVGNDDLYYACADIVLKGEVVGGADAGAGDLAPPRDPRSDASTPSAGDPSSAVSKPAADASKPSAGKADAGKADARTSSADAGVEDDEGESEEHGDHEGDDEGDEEGDEEDDTGSSSSGGCSAQSSSRPASSSALALSGLSLLALAARRRRR